MAGVDALLSRLKQRKLWQWALAYVAGSWVLLQIIDLLTQNLDLPHAVFRGALVLLVAGLPAVLVLAWYHGEKGRQRASGVELLMLSGIFVVAGAGLAFVSVARRGEPVAPGASQMPVAAVEKASIAVLPFLDMSPKHDQDYFSDGLTEELLNVLAKVPALRVAARTSSFAFKGKDVEVDSIGRALRVAHVLEGSVRTDGVRVRITAQLIDVRSGYHVWSETYDRDLKDVFALQDEISKAIAAQLRLELGTAAPAVAAMTTDPEAHRLLLRAMQVARPGTPTALSEAERLFKQAISRDPGYARAHAEIAVIYAQQAYRRLGPPDELYARAESEARRALALDAHEAAAHGALGRVADSHRWDFRAAEEQYRLAVEANPSDARVRSNRAWLLMRLRRTDEALAEATRSTTLDPLSGGMMNNLAAMYSYAGQTQKSIETLQAALALEPSSETLLANLATSYSIAGQPAEALRTIEEALRVAPDDDFVITTAGYIYALSGRRADAGAQLKALERRPETSPYLLAEIHLALGNRDQALSLLRKAVQAHDDFAGDAAVDPVFAPLRSDPRFQSILKEGGLT